MTKDEAQHRYWTFYEAINVDSLVSFSAKLLENPLNFV